MCVLPRLYLYIGNILIYDISGYRYCDKIGRIHRSNHVRLVLFLDDELYMRSCLDPDCRGPPRSSYEIPLELNPFSSLYDMPVFSGSSFDEDERPPLGKAGQGPTAAK